MKSALAVFILAAGAIVGAYVLSNRGGLEEEMAPATAESAPARQGPRRLTTPEPVGKEEEIPKPVAAEIEPGPGRIEVKLVDRTGAAVAGIPVILTGKGITGKTITTKAVRSSWEGLAGFFDVRLEFDWSEKGARVRAHADIVSSDPPHIEMGVEAIDGEPAVLVLPDFGRVVVEVDASSAQPLPRRPEATITAGAETSLGDFRPHPMAARETIPCREDRAVFGRVAVGSTLHVSAQAGDAIESGGMVIAGPKAAGEEVVVRLTLALRVRLALIRPTTSRGEVPTKKPEILEMVTSKDGTSARPAPSSYADGILRAQVSAHVPGTTRILAISSEQSGMVESADVELSRDIAPGETDLGVVRLAPPPLIAAGSVVDPEDRPVAGATVRLDPQSNDEGAEEDEAETSCRRCDARRAGVSTDRFGRFEVRDLCTHAGIEIEVWHPDFLRSGAVRAKRGADAIVVKLSRRPRVTGVVLLDKDVPAGDIELFLESERLTDASFVGSLALRLADGNAATGEHPFTIPCGDAGNVRLVARSRFDGVVLQDLTGIASSTAAAIEKPVVIDLRSRLHVYAIQFVDTSGSPVRRAVCRRATATRAKDAENYLSNEDGFLRLAATTPKLEIRVVAPFPQPDVVTIAAGKSTVTVTATSSR